MSSRDSVDREEKSKLIESSETTSIEAETEDDTVITITISRTLRIIIFVIAGLLLAGLIGLLTTITILIRDTPETSIDLPSLSEAPYIDCGGNAEEANRRNCTFDWMMHAWFTPECHHPKLLQEYMEKQEWEWYLTPDATEKIPTSVIAKGEHLNAYTTEWFHREHCTYMWKKQLLYVNEWAWFDSISHEFEHSDHCSNFVLQNSMFKARNDTVLVPGYPKCISLREQWPKGWGWTDAKIFEGNLKEIEDRT